MPGISVYLSDCAAAHKWPSTFNITIRHVTCAFGPTSKVNLFFLNSIFCPAPVLAHDRERYLFNSLKKVAFSQFKIYYYYPRVSLREPRAPATEHISNLHCFQSNEVITRPMQLSIFLCECGVIWIKNDGAFLITNKQTRTYAQH